MLASEVFQQYVPRLERLVEQVAKDYHKQAELIVEGAYDKIDQQMFNKLLIPLEHLLRNAVSHGLEEDRAGKSEIGKVTIRLCCKEDTEEMIINVTDMEQALILKRFVKKHTKKIYRYQIAMMKSNN